MTRSGRADPRIVRQKGQFPLRAAKIQDSVRQVLRHDWNPIGFGDVLPEDEYDRYIAPVYRILAGSRSEQELIECLFRLERDIIRTPCEFSRALAASRTQIIGA